MKRTGSQVPVGILCLGLALGVCTRLWGAEPDTLAATVPSAAEPTPDQLRARIAQLEGDLQAARVENGRLSLENVRLRKLCQQAGVDPAAAPKATPVAAAPGQAIDPEVTSFLSRPGGLFYGPFAVGQVGTLPVPVLVSQVIDATTLVISVEMVDKRFIIGMPSGGLMEFGEEYRLRIVGVPTAGMVDGKDANLGGAYRVKGTHTDHTIDGGKSTVFELEPFDVNAYLAGLTTKPPATPGAK